MINEVIHEFFKPALPDSNFSGCLLHEEVKTLRITSNVFWEDKLGNTRPIERHLLNYDIIVSWYPSGNLCLEKECTSEQDMLTTVLQILGILGEVKVKDLLDLGFEYHN